VPDVGSRRQWCLKTIDILNCRDEKHNSRDEKHSDNHRSYLAKCPMMLWTRERLRKIVVHHAAITVV